MILDGKAISSAVESELIERTAVLHKKGIDPCLAVVVAGEDPASQIYVRNKEKACARVGIRSECIRLAPDIDQSVIESVVLQLAEKQDIHGIIVQLPLPSHLDAEAILRLIPPEKDVDGFSSGVIGDLSKNHLNDSGIAPCTPKGIMRLLHRYGVKPEGKHAVIIGRSDIVGKPVAMMLLNENATVTICHSRTKDLYKYTKDADILIVSVGKPKLITADMIKPGAVVVDVGINRVNGKLCGDVDFDPVSEIASMITPVPGGVGKMTVAMLLENTILAAER